MEEDPAKDEEGDSTDDDGELRSITAGLAPGRHQVVPTRTKPAAAAEAGLVTVF